MRHLTTGLLSLILLSNAALVSAQTITGVSGALTHGSTITITGSNFGTKTDNGGSETFVNAVYSTFTNSLDGGNLERSNQVTTAKQWTLQTATNRGEPGGRFARKVWDALADEPRLGSLEHIPTTSGSRFYTSFWFKTADPNVMTTGKYYRQYFNNFNYFFHNGGQGMDELGGYYSYSNNPNTPTTTTIYGSNQGLGLTPGNTWRWLQFIVCLQGCGSIYGSTDYFEHRINNVRFNRRGSQLPSNHIPVEGSSSNERQAWVLAANGDGNGHSMDVGMMIYSGHDEVGEGGDPEQSFYDFDDVYIDYAFNRAVLSSSSTCSGISTGELQVPTAWSNTSITATLNRGAYASNASLYLYVFNTDNACNATGFPVVLGGAQPAKPTAVRVLPGLAGLVPIFVFFNRRRKANQLAGRS